MCSAQSIAKTELLKIESGKPTCLFSLIEAVRLSNSKPVWTPSGSMLVWGFSNIMKVLYMYIADFF